MQGIDVGKVELSTLPVTLGSHESWNGFLPRLWSRAR